MTDRVGGNTGPYGIGSSVWPGLAKLQEESCEVGQVLAKIIARGGDLDHTWHCSACNGSGSTFLPGHPTVHIDCQECKGKGYLGSGDLSPSLHEELGDLKAALDFFLAINDQVDTDRVLDRANEKFSTYCRWHAERTVAP